MRPVSTTRFSTGGFIGKGFPSPITNSQAPTSRGVPVTGAVPNGLTNFAGAGANIVRVARGGRAVESRGEQDGSELGRRLFLQGLSAREEKIPEYARSMTGTSAHHDRGPQPASSGGGGVSGRDGGDGGDGGNRKSDQWTHSPDERKKFELETRYRPKKKDCACWAVPALDTLKDLQVPRDELIALCARAAEKLDTDERTATTVAMQVVSALRMLLDTAAAAATAAMATLTSDECGCGGGDPIALATALLTLAGTADATLGISGMGDTDRNAIQFAASFAAGDMAKIEAALADLALSASQVVLMGPEPTPDPELGTGGLGLVSPRPSLSPPGLHTGLRQPPAAFALGVGDALRR